MEQEDVDVTSEHVQRTSGEKASSPDGLL